jgi:hypothetical protein
MRNLILKSVLAIVLIFGSMQFVNAQTDTEQKKKELKARREIAKETIGNGDEDNLNTLEREANVGEDPCTIYDDAQWYTGFNQKKGVQGDPQLANTLLRVTQEQLKMKVKGCYQAVVRDYFDQMDIDGKSAAATHIESAGEMVIDQILDDTWEFCRKTKNPDNAGNIIMYMSIRIKKSELVEKIVQGISENQQAKVRFNEEKFRESAMKKFETE